MQYTQHNPLPLPAGRRLRADQGDDRHRLRLAVRAEEAEPAQPVREGQDARLERQRPRLVDRRQHRAHGAPARRQRHGADDERDAQPAGDARRRGGHRDAAQHQRLHAVAVPARRAGRAARDGEDRPGRAVGGGEVLRRQPGRRRGAPRRGLPPLPDREARPLVRDHAEPQPPARRHHPRPALGHHLPRHADHGRGSGAGGVRRHPHADGRRAADPGSHQPRHGRRVAPRRLRRALALRALHATR